MTARPTLLTTRLRLRPPASRDAERIERRAGEWNRTYATEAGRAILACGFGELGLWRVWAGGRVRHPASARVTTKLGPRRREHVPAGTVKRGRLEDVDVDVLEAGDLAGGDAAP